MKNRFVLLTVIGLFALLSCAAYAQDTAPLAVGLRPDAPTYALHGPYPVGTQTFVGEDGAIPLDVRVWYPALNPSGAKEELTYVMHWKAEGLGFTYEQTRVNIAGHALADAKPDLTTAPYPLVVISHGHNSESVFYAWLAEHIASYGFVVFAPDHKEQNEPLFPDWARTTLARPATVSHTIDYAGTLTAADGALAGMIDMEHIAVAGQSGGGTTTLSIAGGRFDMKAYQALCATVTPESAPAYQNSCTPSPDESAGKLAELLGLATVPEGLWEPLSDPRVDVAIPMSPEGHVFNAKGLAPITIPMLIMSGTGDNSVPFDWGVRPVYDYASSQQKILVGFENADHFIFAPPYEDAPTTVDMVGNDFYYLCSDPVWDVKRAHDLINHFTVAFLLNLLKGDQEAAAALAPDAVSFPGISYEAQGF